MIRLLAVVACGAVACQSSSSEGPPSVSALIGPEGGMLVASDGTRVDVPRGALPATATLTLKPASEAVAPSGAEFVSSPWTLEPPWLEFSEPITVTFPVDRSRLDGGPIVLTTAQSTTAIFPHAPVSGYLALATTAVDDAHVAARTTHFATGAAASASCPASCTTSADSEGETIRCSATCVGHDYVLSCNGAPGAESFCTCAVDDVIASAFLVSTSDGGAGESIYGKECSFPSSFWTHSGRTDDAGSRLRASTRSPKP